MHNYSPDQRDEQMGAGPCGKMEAEVALIFSETYRRDRKNSNSKWIKDLNISRDTLEVLEENISRIISDIPHSNILPIHLLGQGK